MPYIQQSIRPEIDEVLEPLIAKIDSMDMLDQDGAINYAITKLFKRVYPMKYFHLNRAMGTLECIKEEYYRRVAAPYEDDKINTNGDV